MKHSLSLCALYVLVVAGCAGQDAREAKVDCKVVPITTASVAGKPRPASELDRRYAEMQLGTSSYRRQNLDRNPGNNNVEDALRDCR